MNNIESVIHAQALMFIYIGIGVLCRKLNITDDHVEKKLTAALMNVVFPCMIFTSMVNVLGNTTLSDVVLALVICIVLVLLSYGLGLLLYGKSPREKRAVMIYSVLSSNAGFVGIPILAVIYGDTGVLYAAIYIAVIRVFTWTVGLRLFSHGKGRSVWRILTNPNNISMAVAVLFHFLKIRLPGIAMDVLDEVGGVSTLFCMVMVGSVIASSFRLRRLLSPIACGYSALRLAVIPLLTLFLLRWLGVDPTITGSMVILVAAPAPIMACVFAARYDADKELAALLVLVSTLLSLVTQPALIHLCSI